MGAAAADAGRVGQRRAGAGGYVSSATVAARIWEDAWPARDFRQPAQWIKSLGLDPDGVPGALDRLRWHPSCPVEPWRERGDWRQVRSCPALLAPLEVVGPPGGTGLRTRTFSGVLAWYLRDDGRSLAMLRGHDGKVRPGIKTWGTQRGAGVWLTAPDGPRPLLVGLGVPAVWAMAQTMLANGQGVRAVAVPSIHELQGGAVRLPDGALPLWRPEADGARPPLVLARAGAVRLLIPADMECLDLKVRRAATDETQVMTLGPADRADLAAALAVAHWRRAGVDDVRAVRVMAGRVMGVSE